MGKRPLALKGWMERRDKIRAQRLPPKRFRPSPMPDVGVRIYTNAGEAFGDIECLRWITTIGEESRGVSDEPYGTTF